MTKPEIWTKKDQDLLDSAKAYLLKKGVTLPVYKHEIINLAFEIDRKEKKENMIY